MKSRSIRCMKFFLVLFNTLCILLGMVLVAACAINLDGQKSKIEQSATSYRVLSFLLILGVCLMVAAAIGCIFALREQVKVLYVYAGCYIVLVSIELVVIIAPLTVLSTWANNASELRMQFYTNTTTTDEEATDYQKFWNNLQSEYQCCGVDGPEDYAIINQDISASCCARAYPLREGNARRHLHSTCLTERTYYMRGCEEVVRQKDALKYNIIIAANVVFTILEILCVVTALRLARTIRSERQKLQANLQAHFES